MAKLIWDATGEHLYETGVRHGVIYPQNVDGTYTKGVAWNGLTAVTESPSGAEATAIFADDIKYLNLYSAEEFGATIEAYTYPDEFAECDGSAFPVAGMLIGQQARKSFGFCYRTALGNDTAGDDYGYKIHILYGCRVSPSERAYQTINDSPEAITFSWELTTVPTNVNDSYKPTACVVIDSTKVNATKLAALEATLYGVDASEATPAVYAATTDTTKQADKTYYTRSGSGTTESPYVYTEFEGDSFAQGTTYYEMVTPAHEATTASDPTLPLPAEIITALT